jgi:hypothetical protein
MLFPHLLRLSKHVIMIIKQQAKSFILLTQEGKFISYLVIGVRVRVALVALLSTGAKGHGVEAVSSEAAQSAQVLGRLPTLAPITFIFTTAQARGGVHGTEVDVACSNHRSGLALALLLPRSSLILVLALVVACDAPCFQPELLTLMSRSTALTLVK